MGLLRTLFAPPVILVFTDSSDAWMAAPKPVVLLIGHIAYAHAEWEALEAVAELRVRVLMASLAWHLRDTFLRTMELTTIG